MTFAVVTDSTSDIDPSRARELGVTVVPLFVVWGDRSYRDYLDLTRPDFYQKLASEKTLPMTSQPTAVMFEEAFREPAERGQDILCLTISSQLSGTINAARAGAQRFPDRRIEVFDSQSAAGGLGMQVERACALAAAGSSLTQALAVLERERGTQRLYACIPELSHLQRTGRIGKARAAIGTLMKIVPVLCLKDGAVAAEAQVRTFARAQDTMIDLTMKNAPDVAHSRYRVLHTDAPQLAEAAREKLRARFAGIAPLEMEVQEAGPVIAVHAGPHAVGIFSFHD
jgi:DegV family protein with EDD domain